MVSLWYFNGNYFGHRAEFQINPFPFSFNHRSHEKNEGLRLFCVFRVHVYINHRFGGLKGFSRLRDVFRK